MFVLLFSSRALPGAIDKSVSVGQLVVQKVKLINAVETYLMEEEMTKKINIYPEFIATINSE